MKNTVSPFKPRFFVRLLLSSLLIVALSVSFSFGISRYISGVLEREISVSNQAALHQLSNVFDSWLDEVFHQFSQLSTSLEISSIILKDQRSADLSISEILEVRKSLKSIYNPHLEELMIWFPQADRVISRTRSCLSSQQYAACYYPKESLFLQSLTAARTATLVPLKESSSLMILQPLPIMNTPISSAVACAVISPRGLRTLLQSYAPEDGVILLADNTFNILAKAGTDVSRLDLLNRLPPHSENLSLRMKDDDGHEYIVQLSSSKYLSCQYVSAIPSDTFFYKLKNVQYVCLSAFICFTFISIILAYGLSRRNYKPLSNLLSEINNGSEKSTNVASNEIEYLRGVIRNTQDEHFRLRDIKTVTLVRQLLHAKSNNQASLPQQFADAGMSLTCNRFTVFLLQLEEDLDDDASRDLTDTSIQKLFTDMLSNNMPVYIAQESERLYAGLINISDPNNESVLFLLDRICNFFNRSICFSVTIACGTNQDDHRGIRQSYEEAKCAMDYRSVYGANQLIQFNTVDRPEFRYSLCSREDAEQLILSYLNSGKPAPREILVKIHQSCGYIHLPDEFRCYRFDISDLLRRTTEKLSISSGIVDALMACDTLPSFESTFVNALECIRDEFISPDTKAVSAGQQLCKQIVAFIDEHYNDASLSTSAVGSYFDKSGPYLSRLFTDLHGCSIAAYITTVRIRESKVLLQTSDLSVEAISADCGFLSASTFIRLFKKVEGITPGNYRKLYGNLQT